MHRSPDYVVDFQTLIIPVSVETNVRSTACHLVEDLHLIPCIFWSIYHIKSISDRNEVADGDQVWEEAMS